MKHFGQIHDRSSERGMTLMELLMAMMISSILVLLVFQFFSSQASSFIEARQTAEMQQELRWALKYVGDHLKLAGNGVPPTSGWQVLENINGVSGASDTVKVIASYKSLVITTTQTMANEGSQVKVDNSDDIEIGDLAVITDGTFQEIFMVTGINLNHLWHDTAPPWNDDIKLDHRYVEGSSVTIVTYYNFFVQQNDDGTSDLMVLTQNYPAQVLLGNVDDFQVRFKLKDGSWVDTADETYDIRMIEISVRARSPEPLKDYIDPVYGDAYKRLEMKTRIVPKNIHYLDRI